MGESTLDEDMNKTSFPESQTKRSPKKRKSQQYDENEAKKQLLLKRSLTPGLLIAATLSSPEELIEKDLLELSDENRISLELSEIKLLYKAKCEDQQLQMIPKREERFLELLRKSCSGLLFSLKEHGLGKESGEVICQVLSNNKNYSILELYGNRLRDEGTKALSQLMMVNDTIVRLDLRSNDIGGKGGEALFKALRKNHTLTSLDLSGLSGINRNHIGLKGAASLSSMLQVNQVLCQINLGSNGLGADGIKLLCNGLKNNQTLTELDVSSNNMGTQGCEYMANAISTCNIKRLIMERNLIGDKGIAILASVLKQQPSSTLRHLNVAENNISHVGIRDLCQMLKNDSIIHTIQLDGNEIGDKGAEEISSMLEVNRVLASIHLARNEIQDIGCSYLAKSLRINDSLKKLDLNTNYIEDKGMTALSNALKENKSLISLDVSHNRIADEGGTNLAKALLVNQNLQFMSIKENDMKTAGDYLADALKRNTTLMYLDFAFNNFSYKSYSSISEAIERNVRRYKGGAKDRLRRQIINLQKNEVRLAQVSDITRQEISRRNSADEKLIEECCKIDALNNQYEKEINRIKEELQLKNEERRNAESQYQEKIDSFAMEIQSINLEQRKIEGQIDSEREKIQKIKREITSLGESIESAKRKILEERKPFLIELENEDRKLIIAKEKIKMEESELENLKRKLRALEALEKQENQSSLSKKDTRKGSTGNIIKKM